LKIEQLAGGCRPKTAGKMPALQALTGSSSCGSRRIFFLKNWSKILQNAHLTGQHRTWKKEKAAQA